MPPSFESWQKVGRTPTSAADPLVGLFTMANTWFFDGAAGRGRPARTWASAPPFRQMPGSGEPTWNTDK